MREIKFRAWDKDEDIMIYQNENSPTFGRCEDDRHASIEDVFWYASEDFEIMQYIGLKDKSNKEIYEGDIVKYYNPNSKQEYVRVVKWEEILACFSLYKNYQDKWAQESDWIKIIDIKVLGNIYESPELLEE